MENVNELRPVKAGKVREIYDLGDRLVLVATDRLSAFDVILNSQIPGRGKVLTQMSKFWFQFVSDIIGNHMISTELADMPEFFRKPEFEGRTMLCKKLSMLPIECIVRGYLTGSGYESYKASRTVCGIPLPEGIEECGKIPAPIYTPSTKAQLGLHDENISYEASVNILEGLFPGRGESLAGELRDRSLSIYKKCADYALTRGIIIADTKFEFGLNESGELLLADEVLTPDSSRFWPAAGYAPGKSQPSFDKQFVRDYLKAHPDCNYTLPDEVIEQTASKYEEAYRLLAT